MTGCAGPKIRHSPQEATYLPRWLTRTPLTEKCRQGRKDMPEGDLVNPFGRRVQIPRCPLSESTTTNYRQRVHRK